MYILAYDFGTGGIKASLYDADGACVASGFDAYPTIYPETGFHEQAPEDWWRATVQATRRLTERLAPEQVKAIRALGISGHSLGVVPLDAAGNLLRPTVPIWSDSRAGDEAQEFFREVPEEAWYMKTGNGFPPALYSVFKLMWFRAREPEWFGRTATMLGTKDYVNFRLCGARATDFSYASGTGVYDLAARRYDEDLIAASGLPCSLFPEIVPATQVLGTLTPDAARELGLPQDVKVVAGGVDNSCMALGAGAWREGRAYCSLGSSAWIAVSSATPLAAVRVRPRRAGAVRVRARHLLGGHGAHVVPRRALRRDGLRGNGRGGGGGGARRARPLLQSVARRRLLARPDAGPARRVREPRPAAHARRRDPGGDGRRVVRPEKGA